MIYFNVRLLLILGLVFAEASAQKVRLVDMSHEFNNETLHFVTVEGFNIKVVKNGTDNVKYWLQLEHYEGGTHAGTHIDAPCHYSLGKWALNEIPVERFFPIAAVVDVEQQAQANPDYEATIQDLQRWEIQNGRYLTGNMILLLKTGWGKRWGNKELYQGTPTDDKNELHFPGLHPEAAEWLAKNRNIVAAGTETFSLDYGQSKENKVHDTLLGTNMYFLENIANLWELPPYGAQLFVMPMKLGKVGGAPVRIFAKFTEDEI